MPPFAPISRRKLIQALKDAGFSEPKQRGRHAIMRRGNDTVIVPNPHRSDIGKNLLAEILRQANISREEWEKL
jgi:predicted RNA binding protein YcfA (HicA-like mRNA interferase family)